MKFDKLLPAFLTSPNPELYLSDNYVVFDDETTNLDKGDPRNPRNRIVLTVARLGSAHPSRTRGDTRFFWGGEFEQDGLLDLISQADFVIAHNLKREYGWLKRRGYDLRIARGYCTQIGEYVLAGNRKVPLSLDAVAERYGIEGKHAYCSWLIKHGICPSEIPRSILGPYCLQDVLATEQVFLLQRELLTSLRLLPVTYQRNLVTPCLADIEFNGVQLDADRVRSEYRDIQRAYGDALAGLSRVYGEVNWNSPKQVSGLVYGDRLKFSEFCDYNGNPKRTAGGSPKADGKTLHLLKATTPEQREFHKLYAPLIKLKKKSQNIKKLKACCDSEDKGLMYASFNQTVTRTHRLSSTGGRWKFQFHNFDRGFKPLFKARDDKWFVGDADAPQLEFRGAAFFGQDANAQELIRNDGDVHGLTARVLGVTRQNAKAHTFKPLYGGESGTKKEKAYYKAFREAYPQIYEEQERWVQVVRKTKQLRIASGLIFYWPDTTASASGYVKNKASIFNYPVQSFATADIIPLSLVILWHLMAGMRSFIVNTIHDSIIAEIHPDEVEIYKEYVEYAFTSKTLYDIMDSLYGVKFNVPLGAGLKIAPHWGDTKEELKYKATWLTQSKA